MKKILVASIIFAAVLSGCKKDSVKPNNPNNEEQQVWNTYSKENSQIPDNQVNALTIDKNDIKWAGTANGLVKIQGSQFTVFNKYNSPLPSSFIRSVAVTETGAVWVGTDNGIAKYDGTNWSVYTTANSVMTNDAISCITYDAKNHTTWVGTEEGLVKVDAQNHWELHDEIDDLILSLAVDQNGVLWMGAFNHFAFRGSIKKFSNGQWTSYQLDQRGYASTFPYSLAIDSKNNVLAVLTGTATKSVVRINGPDWQEITRPEDAHGLKTLALEGDKVWVGGTGLSVFGNAKSKVLTIPGSQSNILAMAVDSKSRKWLGTQSGGLAVYGKK